MPDFAAASSTGGVQGLRIGVPWDFLEQGVDDGALARLPGSLAVLEGAGRADRRRVAAPRPHAIATYYIVATAEASSNLARFDGVRYGLRAAGAADLQAMYGRDPRPRLRRPR